MPNIEILHIHNPAISELFLLPKKLLPSLQIPILEYMALVDNDNWNPFVWSLVQQMDGVHPLSEMLIYVKGVHICLEVQKQIQGLVGLFEYFPDPDKKCLFDLCLDWMGSKGHSDTIQLLYFTSTFFPRIVAELTEVDLDYCACFALLHVYVVLKRLGNSLMLIHTWLTCNTASWDYPLK